MRGFRLVLVEPMYPLNLGSVARVAANFDLPGQLASMLLFRSTRIPIANLLCPQTFTSSAHESTSTVQITTYKGMRLQWRKELRVIFLPAPQSPSRLTSHFLGVSAQSASLGLVLAHGETTSDGTLHRFRLAK
jgi:tRNA(Leu) C34 or U34 (ribose-2'-O)-methylase TrmL